MLAGSQSGLLYAAPLLGGDDGTEQTIRMIRSLVDDAWKDPFVNRAAIEIIRAAGVAPYDTWGQVRALYDFAHSFYFVNDPISKEALRPTRELLQLRAGDCDDINGIVLPSLLGSIGLETRVVTIAADPEMPDAFSHIYCEVSIDGTWYALDAARPDAAFGVAPPNYFRREWWSLTDSSHGDYSGDNGIAGYAPHEGFFTRDLSGAELGLGSATSIAAGGLTALSSLLTSVSGQTVQPAQQGAIGPGGAAAVSPASASASSATTDLIILALALAAAWLLL